QRLSPVRLWPAPRRTTRSARRATRTAITWRPITGSTGIRLRSRERSMLIKRTERNAQRGSLAALAGSSDRGLDRRTFLARSGLVAGGLAGLGSLPLAGVRKAEAGPPPAKGASVEIRKSICTHCAVGCTVTAEV